jgi:hypothetical protein
VAPKLLIGATAPNSSGWTLEDIVETGPEGIGGPRPVDPCPIHFTAVIILQHWPKFSHIVDPVSGPERRGQLTK